MTWILWAVLLIIQNFAFTFVSRARNSGSLRRHMVASVFSNGVWFISQTIIFSKMFAMMTGRYGTAMAVFTGVFYTFFTLTGAMCAHYLSLRTEKGKSAVGANAQYAQITIAEWAATTRAVDALLGAVNTFATGYTPKPAIPIPSQSEGGRMPA